MVTSGSHGITIAGYTTLDVIHRSARSLLWRAVRDADGTPVYLKTLPSRGARASDARRLRAEYAAGQAIDHPNVVRYLEIIEMGDGVALVVEDFGGASLERRIARGGLTLSEALHIGCAMCDALSAVHDAHIIHADVKPANIAVSDDGAVKLLDFGLASRVTREQRRLVSPTSLQGTLAYLAPELTGRTNRTVDHRVDLYALGITLYHALTGAPPFVSDDPLELVHAHLARRPESLHSRGAAPPFVSAVVDRLLAKTPEDRYLSARGVRHDLATALAALERGAPISDGPVGTHDAAIGLTLPEKLYGRDDERAALLDALADAATGRPVFIGVEGEAGSGKTSVVQELLVPLLERKGYFGAGKFDQLRRDLPYDAFAGCIRDLTAQVLSEPEAVVSRRRDEIVGALDGLGGVLVAIEPVLERIVGRRAAVEALDGDATRVRMEQAVGRFVGAFARVEHPTVLFLDDLQWADAGTVRVIEQLALDRDIGALLIVGAWRGSEVDDVHPVRRLLRDLSAGHADVRCISVGAIAEPAATAFVADALGVSNERAQPLAQVVAARTAGNPFFIRLFLRTLYVRGLIDRGDDGAWTWDADAVAREPMTDNAAELALERMRTLPEDTLKALQALSIVGQASAAELESWFGDEALSDRLTAPETADVLIHQRSDEEVTVSFAHDRLQRAAYDTIAPASRAAMHDRVGRSMQSSLDLTRGEALFQVVFHRNRAPITDATIALEVAELNARAGERASSAIAWSQARQYFERGLELLGDERWSAHAELTRRLMLGAADAARMAVDREAMRQHVDELLANAATPLDRVPASMVRILEASHDGRSVEVVAVGRELLAMLGEQVPSKGSLGSVFVELMKTRAALRGVKPQSLLEQEPITDPLLVARMTLLREVLVGAYFMDPLLMSSLVLRSTRISARHGTVPSSGFTYAAYGMLEAGVARRVGHGVAFGELGVALARRADPSPLLGRTLFVHHSLCAHWRYHLEDSLAPLREATLRCADVGDVGFATAVWLLEIAHRLLLGRDLEEVVADGDRYVEGLRSRGQARNLNTLLAAMEAMREIRGRSEDPPYFDDDARAGFLVGVDHMTPAWMLLFGALAAWVCGDTARAEREIQACAEHIESCVGQIVMAWYHALDGLIAAAHERLTGADVQARRRVRRALRHLERHCVDCPANFEALTLLLRGERAAMAGRSADASAHFMDAVESARRHRYTSLTAIAAERCADAFAAHERTEIEQHFLAVAARAYALWGARAPVMRIHARRPEEASAGTTRSLPSVDATLVDNSSVTYVTPESRPDALDLASVLKAAGAIAESIHVDELVPSMLRVLMENAGAQRGRLLLPEAGTWAVRAFGEVGRDGALTTRAEAKALEAPSSLPMTLIGYATRTGEAVLVDDARSDDRPFARDPWLRASGVRSVLAIPLRSRGVASAVVLLENDDTVGAFTKRHLQVLQMLSGQASIAFENARLFERAVRLGASYERFVPKQFLELLGKDAITDVELGDQVQRTMTVLFSDIRSFTTLCEQLTPQETFSFINEYLGRMEPVLHRHGGFIDKYIGDAIMALFAGSADDAVRASVDMLQELERYNEQRVTRGDAALRIGIGLNTGVLTLGTVGGTSRMDGTVVSDAVNVSARMESLTKELHAPLLMTGATRAALGAPDLMQARLLARVVVRGRTEAVDVFEVFAAESEALRSHKLATRDAFERAVASSIAGEDARDAFATIAAACPDDLPAAALARAAGPGVRSA